MKNPSLILYPLTNIHNLHTIYYTFPQGADKENLYNNKELL